MTKRELAHTEQATALQFLFKYVSYTEQIGGNQCGIDIFIQVFQINKFSADVLR